MATRSLRPMRPLITIDRALTALAVVVVAIGVAASLRFGFLFLYIVYLLVTVFVVRSVPVEPGTWLGLRLVRRAVVVVTTLISLDFLTLSVFDTWTLGVPLLVALALCDLALGRATRRIATAGAGQLDERQETLRNQAHRIAYVILAVSVGLVVVLAELVSPGTRSWLITTATGGGAVTFVQLLFFLPAMVIAWIEPDRIPDEDASRIRRNTRARIAYGMVAVAVTLPVALGMSLTIAPLRVTTFTQAQPPFPGQPGQTANGCEYFQARAEAGIGFSATVPISAVACWNGTTAFEDWGLNDSDCLPYFGVMVVPQTLECRRVTGADGTLHFTYRSRLRSAILPFVSRDIELKLDLSKDGKVVQFP